MNDVNNVNNVNDVNNVNPNPTDTNTMGAAQTTQAQTTQAQTTQAQTTQTQTQTELLEGLLESSSEGGWLLAPLHPPHPHHILRDPLHYDLAYNTSGAPYVWEWGGGGYSHNSHSYSHSTNHDHDLDHENEHNNSNSTNDSNESNENHKNNENTENIEVENTDPLSVSVSVSSHGRSHGPDSVPSSHGRSHGHGHYLQSFGGSFHSCLGSRKVVMIGESHMRYNADLLSLEGLEGMGGDSAERDAVLDMDRKHGDSGNSM